MNTLSKSGLGVIFFILMTSVGFSQSPGVSSAPLKNSGKIIAMVKDMEEKNKEIESILDAWAGDFKQRDVMSRKIRDLLSKIEQDINKAEFETWAEIERTIPLRSTVGEMKIRASAIGVEQSLTNYPRQFDNLKKTVQTFRSNLKDLTKDIESILFTDVKRHAQVIEYGGKELIIPPDQRERLGKAIVEWEAKHPKENKITVFSWSQTGHETEIANKRADKATFFIKSVCEPKEILRINMDKEYKLYQKLFFYARISN